MSLSKEAQIQNTNDKCKIFKKFPKTLAIITILWYNISISKSSDYTSLQIVQLPTSTMTYMRIAARAG